MTEPYVALAESLYQGGICFDPTQDRPQSSTDELGALYEFMLENSESWIFERPIVVQTQARIDSGVRVILHGEKGCGKTTVIHSLARRMTLGQETTLFLICDFNYETMTALFDEESDPRHAVIEHINEVFNEGLAANGLASLLEAGLDLLVTKRSRYFEAFRSAITRLGSPAAGLDNDGLELLLERDPNLRSSWDLAYQQYLAETPPTAKMIDRFRACVRSQIRITIAIDNIDQLPEAHKDAVAKAALSIATLDEQRLGVIVACRTSNVTHLMSLLDTARAWGESAMPFPKDDSWDIEKILKQRMTLLRSPDLRNLLAKGGWVSDTMAFTRAMQATSSKLSIAMRETWGVLSPQDGRRDDEIPAALVAWHNGNIRNISQSLVHLGYSRVDPGHLGQDHPATKRRARNQVYRHIVVENHPGAGEGGIIHPALALFVADPEYTKPHRPFYFLRYRLLAFLTHRGNQSVGTILDTFEQYGVSSDSLIPALNHLSMRDSHDTGLIRFSSTRGAVTHLEDDAVETYVELLPAGKYVTKTLVTKCEYMYWAALDLNDCAEAISSLVGEKADDLRSSEPTDLNKVLVSTILLTQYLLPRFSQEHPYMTTGVWDGRDEQRIRKFQRHFGYQKDSWFIKRARESIAGHAREARVPLPDWARGDLARVQACEGRLDRVLDAANR